jgi:hypothetical protein
VPSDRTLRFVVNGTATERLAVLEGGRVAVRLELQVQRRCCGDYLRVRLRVRGLLYISLPFLASLCAAAATVGYTGWAFGGALQ